MLNKFDLVLEECCKDDRQWIDLLVDRPEFGKKALLLAVLSFSAQLLENSSEGWEEYDSTEVSSAQLKLTTGRSDILTLVCSFPQHLIWLLFSTDLRVVAMALKVLSNLDIK